MKVWIVLEGENHEGAVVDSVHATEAGANRAAAVLEGEIPESCRGVFYVDVEEWEVVE